MAFVLFIIAGIIFTLASLGSAWPLDDFEPVSLGLALTAFGLAVGGAGPVITWVRR